MYESAQLSAQVAEGTVLAGGTKVRRGAYKAAVQTLALAYSTHSGYRKEWKP
ncbi:DUF6221 family protein [Streptosporangium amethystogenes]|uniref:DUF6221 family protein n=1 Tax=Streptosporangium amethystogenes TaxID=2002 RepID=UPI00247FCD94|nr:DUF6221 family protein [Streptosporangium amethystogenes]